MLISRTRLFSLNLVMGICLSTPAALAKITGPCSVLLGNEVQANTHQTQSYVSSISANHPSISGHRLGTPPAVIYPGTAYWDAVFSAATLNDLSNDTPIAIFEDTNIAKRPFILPESKDGGPAEEFKLQSNFQNTEALNFDFSIYSSRKDKPGQLRFEGKGRFDSTMSFDRAQFNFDNTKGTAALDSTAFYSNLATRGLAYGESYQGLKNIEVQGNLSQAKIKLDPNPDFSSHALPPAVLDNALHSVAAILVANIPGWPIPANEVALPVSFSTVEFNSKIKIAANEELFVNARVQSVEAVPNSGLEIKYDVLLTNAAGEAIVFIRNGMLRSTKFTRD